MSRLFKTSLERHLFFEKLDACIKLTEWTNKIDEDAVEKLLESMSDDADITTDATDTIDGVVGTVKHILRHLGGTSLYVFAEELNAYQTCGDNHVSTHLMIDGIRYKLRYFIADSIYGKDRRRLKVSSICYSLPLQSSPPNNVNVGLEIGGEMTGASYTCELFIELRLRGEFLLGSEYLTLDARRTFCKPEWWKK